LLPVVRANVPERPKPPGWPNAAYADIVRKLEAATFVVIDFGDGTKTMVADADWLRRLRALLAAAPAKPDNYCFCINYPQVTFADKSGPLARMEVPHGNKVRLFVGDLNGDFVVGDKLGRELIDLFRARRADAIPYGKRRPLLKLPATP
jgi:hypothetical protein